MRYLVITCEILYQFDIIYFLQTLKAKTHGSVRWSGTYTNDWPKRIAKRKTWTYGFKSITNKQPWCMHVYIVLVTAMKSTSIKNALWFAVNRDLVWCLPVLINGASHDVWSCIFVTWCLTGHWIRRFVSASARAWVTAYLARKCNFKASKYPDYH